MNTTTSQASGHYGSGIRGLHWLLFGLFMVQYGLVWLFDTFHASKSTHAALVATHMSTGTLILLVALCLVASRACSNRPSNDCLPSWQQRLAGSVHLAIYTLMLAQPLAGLGMVMGSGHGVPIFGLFTVPPLISNAPTWLGAAHTYIGWTLFWLLLFHIAAALYHALIRQDGVLRRMIKP